MFIFGRRGRKRSTQRVANLGTDARAVQGWCLSLDDLDRLYAAVMDESRTLDVVFANAGTGSQFRSVRSPPSTSTRSSTST